MPSATRTNSFISANPIHAPAAGGRARHDQALGEHAADDPPTRRAERNPHCQVLPGAGGAADEQRGHVAARDEQHEQCGRGEGPEHGPHAAGQHLGQRRRRAPLLGRWALPHRPFLRPQLA